MSLQTILIHTTDYNNLAGLLCQHDTALKNMYSNPYVGS